jgi:hypothetical protein
MPNLKLVAFWLAKPPQQRAPEEQLWVEAVTSVHSDVAAVEQLAQQFRQAFKDRDPVAFNSLAGTRSRVADTRSERLHRWNPTGL